MKWFNKLYYLIEWILKSCFLWLSTNRLALLVVKIVTNLLTQIIQHAEIPCYTPLLGEKITILITATLQNALLLIYLYHKPAIKNLFKKRSNHTNMMAALPITFCIGILPLTITIWVFIQDAYLFPWLGKTVKSIIYFSNIFDFIGGGIMVISCLVPITEELFFRGLLQQQVYDLTSKKWGAAIISAALFSLAHGCMRNALLYFVAGCSLSYLFYKTNHIIYPILAHAMHNLISAYINYFLKADPSVGHLMLDGILAMVCWGTTFYYFYKCTLIKSSTNTTHPCH